MGGFVTGFGTVREPGSKRGLWGMALFGVALVEGVQAANRGVTGVNSQPYDRIVP